MTKAPINPEALASVTGVQLAQGLGVQPAQGFWADAWSQVMKRPGAVGGLCWLSMMVFFAIFSPFIASGHPIVLRELDASGAVVRTTWPLFNNLAAIDVVLLIVGLVGGPYVLFGRGRNVGQRLGTVVFSLAVAGLIVLAVSFVQPWLDGGDAPALARRFRTAPWFRYAAACVTGVAVAAPVALLPIFNSRRRQAMTVLLASGVTIVAAGLTWSTPITRFGYQELELSGSARATYTLIPFSPGQRYSELDRSEPGTTLGKALDLPPESAPYQRRFLLGTDTLGQDVLAQLLHACRLALSIGLVSTRHRGDDRRDLGCAGGLLRRVDRTCCSSSVSSRSSWRCRCSSCSSSPRACCPGVPHDVRDDGDHRLFTWTGAARFTRAEFMKLRNAGLRPGAKATGLPAPVHPLPPHAAQRRDARAGRLLLRHRRGHPPRRRSATWASARSTGQSWGKLLSNAMSDAGDFRWWLAVFPGVAIFLTALSYNLSARPSATRSTPSSRRPASDARTIDVTAMTTATQTAHRRQGPPTRPTGPLIRVKRPRRQRSTTAAGPRIQAVDGVRMTVYPRQTLAVVGESGCGKSVTAMSILQLMSHARPAASTAARSSSAAPSAPVARSSTCSPQRQVRDAPDPRQRDRHDLPGADDQPQPGLHRGRSDHRGHPAPPGGLHQGGPVQHRRQGHARCRHPRPEQASRPTRTSSPAACASAS
jgi:ABC-type dipeptide/oligopeptide/nickel transport system permease subunit